MSENKEEWRAVVGHAARYQVSDLGRVRLRRSRVVIEQKLDGEGYPVANLHFSSTPEVKRVGVMVAEAFHGGPVGLGITHLDGKITNSAADNVRWKAPAGWRAQP